MPVGCRDDMLKKFHHSKFTVHPGDNKMYQYFRRHYWWKGMKGDMARYMARCMVCQQVKAEHQKPAGILQPLPIVEWKWKNVTMEFVTGLQGHSLVMMRSE